LTEPKDRIYSSCIRNEVRDDFMSLITVTWTL